MERIRNIIEELFDKIEFPDTPNGLYDPLRYMIGIGGKRIRPTICLLSYSLFKDEFTEEVLAPAAAIEIFHTFTLIHDDIMDRSPMRRGQQTVWKKWNEDTAILSGDVMLIDAYKRIAQAPNECREQVLSLFSTTAAQVCEGQQYDMDFEQRDDVSMSEYEKMIGLKTAVLIACAAQMGAIMGNAPKTMHRALYDYGYQVGMAFQVADDYLDAFGDEKVFGKPIGGDILQQKKSWLTIKACSKTTDPSAFMSVFRTKNIEKVKSVYVQLGVDLDARNEIEKYNSQAISILCQAGFSNEQIQVLKEFADSLVGRVK
ncbi:MAG TPA: polyprenyl synthetase [Rikenellaceae bacterium]|nr:polyprenyl synthetase [Rikenellaceae bacterium]